MTAPIDMPTEIIGSPRADAELLDAARQGDVDAYGSLFSRHRAAADRLAASLLPAPTCEDLVQDAFVKIWDALQSGKGPSEFFRAYLLTTIRRLHIDAVRATQREHPLEHDELDVPVEFDDTIQLGFERGTTAKAFFSLPERWQMVLWHLDVEGQKPAQVATLLGVKPNAVSALAYRAREGLRQAYLQHHIAPGTSRGCQDTISNLGAFVRGGLSKRDRTAVEAHLDECRSCTGLVVELREYNGELGALLGPAVLGIAALGYLPKAAGVSSAIGLGAAGTTKLTQSSGGTAGAAAGSASLATTIGVSTAVALVAAVAGVAGVQALRNDSPTKSPNSTEVAGPVVAPTVQPEQVVDDSPAKVEALEELVQTATELVQPPVATPVAPPVTPPVLKPVPPTPIEPPVDEVEPPVDEVDPGGGNEIGPVEPPPVDEVEPVDPPADEKPEICSMSFEQYFWNATINDIANLGQWNALKAEYDDLRAKSCA